VRTIALSHGAGGSEHAELLRRVVLPALGIDDGAPLLDAAVLSELDGRPVLTTDGFVVQPLRFAGGSIGTLAFCGTVNDLAMLGARPLALTVGLVIEAGLDVALLRAVLCDLGALARQHGVRIVAGDTKVVERGKGDGVFVTTAGLGVLPPGRVAPHPSRIAVGDVVLVNGALGDHGAAIVHARAGRSDAAEVSSDAAPLHGLVEALYAAGVDVHCLRDPTRGGVAEALHGLAHDAGVTIALDEAALPVRPAVAATCELLGLDPLQLANEGKLLAFVPADDAAVALAALRSQPQGADAAIAGVVADGSPLPLVTLRTRLGGRRVVARPVGEQLPRIC